MAIFFNPRTRSDGETFVGYDHFPVSLFPSDGVRCVARDRVSHLGVNYNDPVWHESPDGTVWAVWLTGTTKGPPEALVPLARSWLEPPELRLEGNGFVSEGYDRAQRAYVVRRTETSRPATLLGHFTASDASPLARVCLLVKGWGEDKARIEVRGVGAGIGSSRTGYLRSLEGTDLLVWLDVVAQQRVSVRVSPAR